MTNSTKVILIILIFYISTSFFLPAAFGAIVINEIMYNPNQCDDSDCEWVELYNTANYAINLTDWTIDGNSIGNENISAKGFLVVARELTDGTDTDTESYEAFWGNNDTIWNSSDGNYTAADGYFVLSNTQDTINLTNGTSWDAITYFSSWGANGDGYTLERIDPNEATNSSTNWRPSNSVNGTPGSKNSVTPTEHDLSVYPENITFSPTDPSPRTGVNISVTVQNSGISNETNVNISLYNISSSNLTLIHSQLSNKTKQSSTSFTIKWNNTIKGNSTILVRIENFTDDNTTNNNATKIIPFDFHLVINEIMYNPPGEIGSDADFEWLEIYNNATYTENLTGWILQCDSKSKSLSDSLSSGNYLVIAKDKTQFYTYYSSSIATDSQTCSLNNDGDTIKLIFNDSGIYHEETVTYSPSWGADGTGYSLEKRNPINDNNPTNWAESKAYSGTPGARNNPDNQIKSSLKNPNTVTVYSSNTEIIYLNKTEESPDYKIISFPEIAYVNEPFKTIVSLKSADEQIVSVYSYVYDGKILVSEGFDGNIWKARWTANKKEIKIGPDPVYGEFENKIKPDTSPGQYKLRARVKDEIDLTKNIEVLLKRASVETNTSEQATINCEQVDKQARITINSSIKLISLLHFSKEPIKNETLDVNGSKVHTVSLEEGYNSIIFVENNKILHSCSFSLQKSSPITGRATQITPSSKIFTIVKSWLEKLNFLNVFRDI